MKTMNPATGKILHTYTPLTDHEAAQKVEAAHAAFAPWREAGFEARAALLLKAAEILSAQKETFASKMTEEMGKVKKEALAEVEKCAWVCRFYAEKGAAFLQDEVIETEMKKSFVSFQPLGVILAIMPWNFPFWQVWRFAAPTLLAGNTAVLKHATSVSGCALLIEDVFKAAGFPEGVFQTMLLPSKQVEAVIAHPKVRAVTLTGSVEAGRAVAATAGKYLKKTVLELGGSDPYLILADADVEKAARQCVAGRLGNNGQSCISAKRFIVHADIHDAFVARVKALMAEKVWGDPSAEGVDLGPMAAVSFRDELHAQVQASVKKGAILLLGGKVPEGDGAYYPPTLLTGVKEGMPAYDEELFGPVASVIKVASEEEAIRIANGGDFGLGGAIFSENEAHATRLAREVIDTGSCFVNTFVASDPRLPFGGVKNSGYGREMGSFGIREFVNIKTVSVAR